MGNQQCMPQGRRRRREGIEKEKQEEEERQRIEKEKQDEEERQRIEKEKQEEEERQRIEKEKQDEEERQGIEKRTKALEKQLHLYRPPQRQETNTLNELSERGKDDLVLYKVLSTSSGVENQNQIYRKLPILLLLGMIVIAQKYKRKIINAEKTFGSYRATEKFFTLASTGKLSSGWSHKLLEVAKKVGLEGLIIPNQEDLDDFNNRIGIPRGSLLHTISEKLRVSCRLLLSPMGRIGEESDEVPNVHPELCITEEYFFKDTAFMDGTYRSSKVIRKAYKDAKRVWFTDLTESNVQTSKCNNLYSNLLRHHHGIFLFLIGPAGSGKTTITKRIVKTCNEERKIAFFISFSRLGEDDRWSLKNLLLKFPLFNELSEPSEELIDQNFAWVVANQDKCTLVLDGLDQSAFTISNELIPANMDDELKPCDLMALILSRRFLPSIRLIVTSRPYSIGNFEPVIRPDVIVFLNDLVSQDAEKLLDHYLVESGGISASQLMAKLRMKSPGIHRLVFNPLFLRFIAMLNNETGEGVWMYVNTTAKLFFEVIDRLQNSAHHESGNTDPTILNSKLADMAFHKTRQRSVVFEQEDLERYGLTAEDVQDLLFTECRSGFCGGTLLVGVMMVFYFAHQSIQEFYTARHALEKLPMEEFKEFVRTLFPGFCKNEEGSIKFDEDPFSIIRLFLIGCINEMDSRFLAETERREFLEKKAFFFKYLSNHLENVFVTVRYTDGAAGRDLQKQIKMDLMDFRNPDVIKDVKKVTKDLLKESKFNLSYAVSSPIDSTSYFIENFVTNLEELIVEVDESDNENINKILNSIKRAEITIELMNITMEIPNVPDVNAVVHFLPYLTNKLELDFLQNGVKDAGATSQQFCAELKTAIEQFDPKKIQSEELQVSVNGSLHIFFRRGELPKFL